MKRFRIVVAGCGGMANTWVKYALEREDTEIVGLVDIREEQAQAMAERHGLHCPNFRDIRTAIQTTGANLVFDVTIPEAHRTITGTALSLGCHVLGEKPIAPSMEEAYAMIKEARIAGKQYAIMQNRRYLKQIRAYRDLVMNGTIGTPGFMTADFFLGPHFGGFRDAMDSPLLLDMAIHTFDQARFITGAEPVSVYCHEFNPPGSWYQGNAAATCIFEMSNGLVFTYNGSWCAEGAPTTWEASWRVTGSGGTAIWANNADPYAEVPVESGEPKFVQKVRRIETTPDWPGRQGHNGCLDEMFAALIEGRSPETVCTDNIKSMAMVHGALESARSGKKVML